MRRRPRVVWNARDGPPRIGGCPLHDARDVGPCACAHLGVGYVAGVGERGDGFHRTRSSPDGGPIITAMRAAIDDAGLAALGDIDYVNAHGTSTPENDNLEALACMAVFGKQRGCFRSPLTNP